MTEPTTLAGWVAAEAEPLLAQGFTQPDVVDSLTGSLPLRYLEQTVRPALARAVAAYAKRAGYVTISDGVNEPGPAKQLALITIEEILIITRKRLNQGDNNTAALMAMLTDYCAANPALELTPAAIIEMARAA